MVETSSTRTSSGPRPGPGAHRGPRTHRPGSARSSRPRECWATSGGAAPGARHGQAQPSPAGPRDVVGLIEAALPQPRRDGPAPAPAGRRHACTCPAVREAAPSGSARRRSPRYLRAWMASRTGPVNAAHHSSWTRPAGTDASPTGSRAVRPSVAATGGRIGRTAPPSRPHPAQVGGSSRSSMARIGHHRGRLVSRGYHPGRWAATTQPDGPLRRPPPVDRRADYVRLLAFAAGGPGAAAAACSRWPRFLSSMGWGFDFQAYLAAAQRLARGDPIYQQYSLDGPFRPGPYGLYLYSPPFAVATLPFTMISVAGGRGGLVPAAGRRCWSSPAP